jgi:hypothetical protein
MMAELTKKKELYLPLGLLFITLASVTDGLCSQSDQAVIQFAMCPVVLWIRSVSESEGGKLHLLQTSWPQSCTTESPPECLTIRRQVPLATGGDGNEDNVVLQQLFLQTINLCALKKQSDV